MLIPTMVDAESKNPIIIDEKADIEYAARLIGTTTFLNAGFLPYNPDYIMVHTSVYESFKKTLVENVTQNWGSDVSKSSDMKLNNAFPKVINNKVFNR